VTATARKIAVLFYNAIRHGMAYQDQGAAAYDERHRQRVLANLQRPSLCPAMMFPFGSGI